MLADHFNKKMQGDSFKKFRAEIQGIPEDTPYEFQPEISTSLSF